MKNTLTTLLHLLLLLLFLTQCKKDSMEINLAEASTCFETIIQDSLNLDNRLTGEWELVYYECGFCNNDISVTGSIVFEKEMGKLTIIEDDVFSIKEFTWTIEPVVENPLNLPSNAYHLVTEPYLHPIGNFHKICDEYIEHDGRANDGGYYLFKKL